MTDIISDSERLAEIRHREWKFRDSFDTPNYDPMPEQDCEFLIRLLDTAQKALASRDAALAEKERELREVQDRSKSAYNSWAAALAERNDARAECERLRAELQPFLDTEKRLRDMLGDPRKSFHMEAADWGLPQGAVDEPRPTSSPSGEPPPGYMDAAFHPGFEMASPPAPTDLVERARKLRREMLEAEISNVLPDTEEGEEIIRQRHLWLIEQALAAERDEASRRERERCAAIAREHRSQAAIERHKATDGEEKACWLWAFDTSNAIEMDICRALSDQPQPDTITSTKE